MIEAEYTYKIVFENLKNIHKDFPKYFHENDSDFLKRSIQVQSIFETSSQNTMSSMVELEKIVSSQNPKVEHLIQVSSPNHTMRCLRDSYLALDKHIDNGLVVSGISSHTCYGGGNIENVLIKDLHCNI